MKKHPAIGYRIVKSFDEFARISDIILAHHEHWDGSGYPKGLKGEDIPLLSRMLLIIDAYLAMTEGRSYRPALKAGEALKELQRHAGKEFDARLVDVFITRLKTRPQYRH